MSTKEQYDAFLEACEELKSSKIILADAKVSNVLRSIVACPTLVEVVGETLVGYNFNGELESVNKNDAGIVMPSEPYRVIAFVFSLLSEIDAGRLDLQEFVDDYFVAETLAQKFDRFNQELITPFKVISDCIITHHLFTIQDLNEQPCNFFANFMPKVKKNHGTFKQLYKNFDVCGK